MKNRIQSYLLLLISTLLLGTGFLNNQFKVAEQKWFQNHQQDTESLVIGRMVKAKRDGIFSVGGLTGQVSGIQQIATDKLQWSGQAVSSQYQAYYKIIWISPLLTPIFLKLASKPLVLVSSIKFCHYLLRIVSLYSNPE